MVWVQGPELHVLTGIRPSTRRFQSTCSFPVSVSTSFPTHCSAKLPGVIGGLRTLLFTFLYVLFVFVSLT